MTPYVHHVRGRLRLRDPSLKNNPALANATAAALNRVPGIRSAQANVVTGSVLVYYEPTTTTVHEVMWAIDALLPMKAASRRLPALREPNAAPESTRIGDKVAKAVFWYALEKAVERAAPLLISAIL
jgi:hypothetical protein